MRVLVEGLRARRGQALPVVQRLLHGAASRRSPTTPTAGPEIEALQRNVLQLFQDYVHLNRRIPDEVLATTDGDHRSGAARRTPSPRTCWSRCRSSSGCSRAPAPSTRLRLLAETLAAELEIVRLERKIEGQVRSQVHKNQKEFYLNEQLKAIRKELGHQNEFASEIDELQRGDPQGARCRARCAPRR